VNWRIIYKESYLDIAAVLKKKKKEEEEEEEEETIRGFLHLDYRELQRKQGCLEDVGE